jgi:uncharacterized protein
MATVRFGDFEWDQAKASANQAKHGVSFPEATAVFGDPRAIDAPDRYEPERFVIIGMSDHARVLFVVHAERGDRIRLISARRASKIQRRLYEEGP